MTPMLDRLSYSPKQAAEVTGIAFTRIREAIYSGELASVEVSSKRRVVRREALIAWLDALEARSA